MIVIFWKFGLRIIIIIIIIKKNRRFRFPSVGGSLG
jgi:hypothetical protein